MSISSRGHTLSITIKVPHTKERVLKHLLWVCLCLFYVFESGALQVNQSENASYRCKVENLGISCRRVVVPDCGSHFGGFWHSGVLCCGDTTRPSVERNFYDPIKFWIWAPLQQSSDTLSTAAAWWLLMVQRFIMTLYVGVSLNLTVNCRSQK